MVKVSYDPAKEQGRAAPVLPGVLDFYDPAEDSAEAPPASGVINPAYETALAPDLIAPIVPASEDLASAPPLYRKGGPVPELIVACGIGWKETTGAPRSDGTYDFVLEELIPKYHGVAVTKGILYGFTINLKRPNLTPTTVGIVWYKSPGDMADQISYVEQTPSTPPDGEWHRYTVEGFPPEDPAPGAFMVPYIRITNTLADTPFYMAGAQIYAQSGMGAVEAFSPDKLLLLGDPNKLLGTDDERGGGYQIGTPKQN